jgi:hypothetical protein
MKVTKINWLTITAFKRIMYCVYLNCDWTKQKNKEHKLAVHFPTHLNNSYWQIQYEKTFQI